MKEVKRTLLLLIEKAAMFGLGKEDLDSVKDLIAHHEFGLGLDTLVTQLHEYNIEIDQKTYDMINEASIKMEIPTEHYSFMKELIKRQ